MNQLVKIIILMTIILSTSLVFAAGDYVWEEKFQEELPAAEKGDVKAQYAVGEMYEKGKGAVKDITKAFEWYLKAANQGDTRSAYKVGLFYLKGDGTAKNYAKAREWLTKSAEKDYVRAEYYLGEIYENGHGVDVDYDEAMKWYKAALAGGFGTASEGISRVARAQRAEKEKEDRRPAPAPPKPRQVVSKPEPKPQIKSTKERVLEGGWVIRKKPVEYLPSDIAKCNDRGSNLECVSSGMKRNIGMAEITYDTKAILFSFKNDGSFKVSYRNNVTSINVTDKEFAESGQKVPVKLGWQDAEHKLTCEFENAKSIACTKNKMRNIIITR